MSEETAGDDPIDLDRLVERSEYVMRLVEVVAALVLVLLFAIGVVDLGLQIVQAIQGGGITDPQVVIGFIDTALLMLIIVEVYQTVVAYTRESETRQIVRLVLYTGVIAMVRKAIIFRTEVYGTKLDALLAASAYALLLLGIGALLFVEERGST